MKLIVRAASRNSWPIAFGSGWSSGTAEADPRTGLGLADHAAGGRRARMPRSWASGHGPVPPHHAEHHPRPMNGMVVAVTVMNCTFASNGSPAMNNTASATCRTSNVGSGTTRPSA